MLSICLREPGMYAACDGEKTLRLCRFEAEEEVTVVQALSLSSDDAELLDGLLRAVLFYGLRQGRGHYRLEEEAISPCRRLLQALGIPEQGEVEKLPRHCREGE